jgi:hypothetical protein
MKGQGRSGIVNTASVAGSRPTGSSIEDDCADMAVAMCCTDPVTGQTIVIDSGR